MFFDKFDHLHIIRKNISTFEEEMDFNEENYNEMV